jgi:lysozyme|tara:strand:- start:732 stop:1706 length:975 start_codon:yes stop_codon:yes gene_type:complete
MALFGITPFNEKQLRGMSGVHDRRDFYLEDDVEEVEEPSPISRLGSNVKDVVGKGAGLLSRGLSEQKDYYKGLANKGADFLTQPRTESGIITQADELIGASGGPLPRQEAKPTSVKEAQARGQKTFWVGDQEKLAVTAEQLADFKASGAYDPNSGRSALSQWSEAWSAPEVATDAPQAPRRGVREILIEEEGFEIKPYTDPGGGRRAVGVGHTLAAGEEERDITEAEARETLETDISKAYNSVDRLMEKFDVGEIPAELRDELMMMAFQMGATGLSKFKKMWAAMKNQDWGEMVEQMGDSRWAKSQTPARATRTINRVKELFGV